MRDSYQRLTRCSKHDRPSPRPSSACLSRPTSASTAPRTTRCFASQEGCASSCHALHLYEIDKSLPQPELETRTPAPTFLHPDPSPRQILVFYPFVLLYSTSVTAEPLNRDEVPLTADEERVMSDAKVVESYEEAEKATEKAPTADGQESEAERAVEEAEEAVGDAQEDQGVEPKQEQPAPPAKKKGWLW